MKRIYLEPEAELVRFYEEDVIRTSNTGSTEGDNKEEEGGSDVEF